MHSPSASFLNIKFNLYSKYEFAFASELKYIYVHICSYIARQACYVIRTNWDRSFLKKYITKLVLAFIRIHLLKYIVQHVGLSSFDIARLALNQMLDIGAHMVYLFNFTSFFLLPFISCMFQILRRKIYGIRPKWFAVHFI